MKSDLELEPEREQLYRAIFEIDTRLTIAAGGLEEWRKEIGVEDLATLICLPGFPAPTDDTAHLPLEQREWSFAAVTHQMLLRMDGIEVCGAGEREENHEIPCVMHLKLFHID